MLIVLFRRKEQYIHRPKKPCVAPLLLNLASPDLLAARQDSETNTSLRKTSSGRWERAPGAPCLAAKGFLVFCAFAVH